MCIVSSTPAGKLVQVPTSPGIRQDLQRAVQVAAQPGWHISGVPEQLPLAQSPATLHFCCGPAALHVAPHDPPQSTSVSSASSRPSEQCVAMHCPIPLHTKPPLSLQGVPSATLLVTQLWLVGSQPTVWQVVVGAGQSFAAFVHAADPPTPALALTPPAPTPPALTPPAPVPPALTPPEPDSPAPPTLEVPAPGPPACAAPASAEPPARPEPDRPPLPFEVAVKVEPLHAVNTSAHAAAHAKTERNRILPNLPQRAPTPQRHRATPSSAALAARRSPRIPPDAALVCARVGCLMVTDRAALRPSLRRRIARANRAQALLDAEGSDANRREA
jgi:hypothetical protein